MKKKQRLTTEVKYICVKREDKKFPEINALLKEKVVEIKINDRETVKVLCTDQYIEELIAGRIFVEQNELHELLPIPYKDFWFFAMADRMPLHEATCGTHSCFLFQNGELLFECEDIGRYNAMDKVIGYALNNNIELAKCAVYASGRVPSDMAEKAIRAKIPILVSKGIPTKDAVELAKKYHLTLVCGARCDQLKIYSDFRKKGMDALILAGGKSSRMDGKHKGNLKIGGETFLRHLINEVRKETDQVWISYGADIHETYENCKIVKDKYVDCGPLGGLHAGLAGIDADSVFVVACDMPFMQEEFITTLKKHLKKEVDIVVPVAEGRIHPLAAVYKKSILPVIEKQLESGNYKLRSIFEKVNVAYVEIKDERMKKMLQNINTIEEYEEIKK